MKSLLFAGAAATLVVAAATPDVRADLALYYVAVDGRPTLPSGVYAGLPNPNFNRLTFRYAHVYGPGDLSPPSSSHFHSIGPYTYTGTPPNHAVLNTSTNNRLPEVSTAQPPLPLVLDPAHPGKLVSKPGTAAHYSDLEIRSINSLDPQSSDVAEAALYSSSNPAFTGSLAGAQLALKLVSKSPGLHVADESGADILVNPGDTFPLLGAGETGTNFAFRPLLWADAAAPAAAYSATFTLVDTRPTGGFGESGTFSFDVQTPDSYDIGFTMDLALKDLGFATDFGRKFGVPLEVAGLTEQIFIRGRETYGGAAWSTMIVKLLEDALKTPLRAEGFPATLNPPE